MQSFLTQHTKSATRKIKDFDCVRLTTDTDVEGLCIPAGAQGAVVLTHGQGEAFEVEFTAPFHAVVGIPAELLALVD